MRSFSLAVVALLAANVVSCAGDSSGSRPENSQVSFKIFKSGMNVDCSAVPEIVRVQVTAFAGDGITRRPGYPRDVNCQEGQVSLSDLDGGDHILEIAAHGKILGDDDAVLFKAKTPISLPTSGTELSLKPEVSYLSIDWTFENEELAPCAEQVGDIEVLLAATTGPRLTFSKKVACTETPLEIPLPLPVLNYTIRVDAYSPEDFPVYTATVQRVLERGDNDLQVILQRIGAAVFFDWQFEIGTMSVRPCNDARVDTSEIQVTIGPQHAPARAMETVQCASDRPHQFLADRFPASPTPLAIDIVAEGAARFIGGRVVDSTGEDIDAGTIILRAVGTATASFSIATSTCATARYDGFSVYAVNELQPNEVFGQDLEMNADTAIFEDLPYGTYGVLLLETFGGVPVCTARGRGVIEDRTAAWPPIRL